MSKLISGLGIACALVLLGCGEGAQKTNKGFTERMAGSAESVNEILYVMGGTSLTASLPDVGAYDPATNSWTRKMPIPTPRALGASAVLGNDIYVIGGRSKKGVLSTVEKYSTAENKWSPGASMPTARWSLMVGNSNDKLYAFGGVSGVGDNRKALDIVEAYDPESDSWQAIGKMPEVRQGAAVAAVDGIIYVISGKIASYAEETGGDPITVRVDAFDPETKAWSRVEDIPTGRVGAKAVVANGLIFVVGGIAKGAKFPTQIDVFDPRSNQWSAGPRLTAGRSGHMCALVGDSILVFGGSSVSYGGGRPSLDDSMEAVSMIRDQPEE